MTNTNAPSRVRARRVTSVRRPAPTLTPLLLLVVGAAALRLQAVVARRRYGQLAASPGPIDLVVPPTAVEPGPPLVLATLGDSGMAGVGAGSIAGSLPVHLARRVADATGRPVHVISTARAGARTADVLADQVPRLPLRPDVLVLMAGTNDVTHLTSWRALARSTAELLDALTATGAPVVVSSLPEVRAMRAVPRPLRDTALLAAAGVRQLQHTAARRRTGVTLVDVRGAVGPVFLTRYEAMSLDAFHPSDTGYGLIADALLPAVLAAVSSAGTMFHDLEGVS